MDPRWRQWIKTNIAQGSDVFEIRDVLVKNGFRLADIKREMGKHFPHEGLVDLGPAQYQAMSEIRITKNATRVPTDLAQMYTLDDFMTAEECDQLIALSAQHMVPSGLALNKEENRSHRTSSTCLLAKLNDPFVTKIAIRIGETLGMNPSYSEGIEIQRYEVGQLFRHHTDFFNRGSEEYKRYASVRGNRTWTFMVYLNDVEQGGGTNFFHLQKTFQPKKGMAVIWNNLLPDGMPNPNTLHAGEPVEQGCKVIITDWYRELGTGKMIPGTN